MRKRPPFLRQWKKCSSPSLPQQLVKSSKAVSWDIGALYGLLDEVKQDVTSTPTTTPEEPVKVESPTPNGQSISPSISRLHNEPREPAPMSISDLPLSPLMDPKLINARTRHRTRKPLPSGSLSPFEQKLQKNPYARALASPMRSCDLSSARLPSAFLLSFGIEHHPKTGDPWHLPRVIVKSRMGPKEIHSSSNDGLTPTNGLPHEEEQDPEASFPEDNPPPTNPSNPTPSLQNSPSPNPTKTPPTRTASGSYYQCSHAVLQHMSTRPRKQHPKFISQRWRTDTGIDARRLVWRQDMPAFTLDLLRSKTCSMLETLRTRPSGYIVPCIDIAQVQKSKQIGAALWLGEDPPVEEEEEEEVTTSSSSFSSTDPNPSSPSPVPPPPFYATLTKHAAYIPFYNLPCLLGAERVRQLRATGTGFQHPLAVIKHKQNTVEVLMQLWQLMGYLATPAVIPPDK